ncbi:MAG: GNAT family N-acetyltransferase [Verrucomicrobiales bacterium]
MPELTSETYSFRPISLAEGGSDLPFLAALYASTRREEMAMTGWPAYQIEAFLRQQFEAQHRFYQDQFSSAQFDIILDAAGEPIGRLYLDEREDEIRVIDIALLPDARGRGIGGRIMADILDKAFASEKTVRIHVEQNNPAMRLYRRLGFKMIEEQGVYYLMEAVPPSRAAA